MVLLQDGFAALGIPAIRRCEEADGQWVTIDEIGYLEAKCKGYHDALHQLLEKKQVAAVVRKQNLPFLTELCNREDVFVVDMDAPFENVGCVILASGMGKRFGGNKLMADFHGKPMILRALQASEALKAHRVVVTRHPDVAQLCRDLGEDVILHDMPYRSDTIRLGLSFLGDVDACLFLPGDQPLLRRQTVEAMVRQWREDTSTILRPFHKDTPGAPAVFPQWAFPDLLTLPEGYTVESLPESSTISSPFGNLQTEIFFADGKIHVVQTLTMNPGRFTAEEYDLYRTFAKDVSKAYSTRVVLRKE